MRARIGLIVRDLALTRSGRACVDYGSGMGSDALLAFAAFRCRRRGLVVCTIDLKRGHLPEGRFRLAFLFDVLEHLARPLMAVRALRDIVTPRMRALGFQPVACDFPPSVRAPRLYEKRLPPLLERAGYLAYDGVLDNALGTQLAAWYRRRRPASPRVGTRADSRAVGSGRS